MIFIENNSRIYISGNLKEWFFFLFQFMSLSLLFNSYVLIRLVFFDAVVISIHKKLLPHKNCFPRFQRGWDKNGLCFIKTHNILRKRKGEGENTETVPTEEEQKKVNMNGAKGAAIHGKVQTFGKMLREKGWKKEKESKSAKKRKKWFSHQFSCGFVSCFVFLLAFYIIQILEVVCIVLFCSSSSFLMAYRTHNVDFF